MRVVAAVGLLSDGPIEPLRLAGTPTALSDDIEERTVGLLMVVDISTSTPEPMSVPKPQSPFIQVVRGDD